MSQLIVLRGIDEGRNYVFEEKISFGATSECNLFLREKNAKDLQLGIHKNHEGYVLSRQKGTAPVFLNSVSLQQNHLLRHEDILQIGLTLIQFQETTQTQKRAFLKNRYRLVRPIIAEITGSYYEAQDQKIQRSVLVYLVSSSYLTRFPMLSEKLLAYGKMYSKLTHDSLPAMLDFGLDGTSFFFVYEFLGDSTLQTILKPGKPLPIPQVFACIKDLAFILRFAQKHQLAHWNLHPNTILLHQGRTILLGLGLERLWMETCSDVYLKAGWTHKLAYLSPEQTRKGDVTALSDLFSLGILFFEMLTGQKPFQQEDPYALLAQIQNDSYPDLRDFHIEVIPRLEKVLAKLLEKDHNRRYQNLRDLTNDLEVCSLIFTYREQFENSLFSRAINTFFFRWIVLPGITLTLWWGMWQAYLRTILEDL